MSGAAGDVPWALAEPEPTTLIALWPDESEPKRTEVLAAFATTLNHPIGAAGEAEPEDDAILWSAAIDLPGHRGKTVVWAEPARRLPVSELDDAAAAACAWVIGAETVLDPDDPVKEFAGLVRLLAAAHGGVTAVLDTNSGQWHQRPALDRYFCSDDAPPEDVLWATHVVVSEGGEGSVWLHTHGLRRCGRPELEMLEVPIRHMDRAAELLSAVVGRIIEDGIPAPGEPYAIGPTLEVAIAPWREVAPYVGGAPGGMQDRADEPDNPHVGPRAVVCAREPRGAYRRTWSWPRDVLERLESGDRCLYLSRHETQRLLERARASWPRFADAFGVLQGGEGRPEVRFLMKAGLPVGAEGRGREHLWFSVRRFDGARAEGTLLNQPDQVTLKRGDVKWIDRDAVSDWSVETPLGRYGPQDETMLVGVLEALRPKPEPQK